MLNICTLNRIKEPPDDNKSTHQKVVRGGRKENPVRPDGARLDLVEAGDEGDVGEGLVVLELMGKAGAVSGPLEAVVIAFDDRTQIFV